VAIEQKIHLTNCTPAENAKKDILLIIIDKSIRIDKNEWESN